MRFRKAGVAGLAAMVLLAAPCCVPQQISAGQTASEKTYAVAPRFVLKDLDGHPLDSVRYKGKVVMLDFWATWCVPCRMEIPHFVELQNKYRSRGFQVIGISMDDEAAPVRSFYREHRMNYPVAMGTVKVAEAYGGVLGLPVTLLIGRDGRIHVKHAGPVEMAALEAEIKALL